MDREEMKRAAALAAITGFMLGASPISEPEPAQASAGLDQVNKDQVTAFAGGPPERCVFSHVGLLLPLKTCRSG